MKKKYRIKSNKEIVDLLRKRKSVASECFIIYHNENHKEEHFRYAISVSSKYGNAVERNLIKRRVKSVIRNLNITNDENFFLVIRPKSKEKTYEEIFLDIKTLLIKAKLLEEANE